MTVSHSLQMLLTLEKCITISHVTLETVPKFETLECPMSRQLYACFFFYFFSFLFSVPDCWFPIPRHRCPSINYEHSAANMWCDLSRARMGEWRMFFFFFFFFFWATGMVPLLGFGALRILHTLHIGSGGTIWKIYSSNHHTREGDANPSRIAQKLFKCTVSFYCILK